MDVFIVGQAIRRHFIVFLAIVIFWAAIGVGINWLMKPQYQAKSTLISNSAKNDEKDSRYTSIMANQLLTKTYEDAIQSLFIANDVKNKLASQRTPTEILKMVKVKTDPRTLMIEIYVNSDNLSEAVNIANAFAETFVSRSKEIISSANVTLLDLSTLENSSEPVSPKKGFNLAICIFIGLFLGTVLAIMREVRRHEQSRGRHKRIAHAITNQNLSLFLEEKP